MQASSDTESTHPRRSLIRSIYYVIEPVWNFTMLLVTIGLPKLAQMILARYWIYIKHRVPAFGTVEALVLRALLSIPIKNQLTNTNQEIPLDTREHSDNNQVTSDTVIEAASPANTLVSSTRVALSEKVTGNSLSADPEPQKLRNDDNTEHLIGEKASRLSESPFILKAPFSYTCGGAQFITKDLPPKTPPRIRPYTHNCHHSITSISLTDHPLSPTKRSTKKVHFTPEGQRIEFDLP